MAVIVKEKFEKPKRDIWNAITVWDEMIQWYFSNLPDFKAEQGFQTEFEVKSEERTFTHIWKVLEVIAEQKIKYSWTYKEYTGEGIVTFSLSEQKGFCELQVMTEGLETFPPNIPEFKEESCRAGWQYFINQNLKNYFKENK